MCETREYAISVKQKAWLNGAFILTALVASFTDGDIITQLHPFILTVAARLSESCRMSLHEFCAIWETLCSSIHVNINALQVVSSQLKLIHRMSDLDLRFRQGREPDFFLLLSVYPSGLARLAQCLSDQLLTGFIDITLSELFSLRAFIV